MHCRVDHRNNIRTLAIALVMPEQCECVMEVITMGRYFVYRDILNDQIKIYHAKDEADVSRVFDALKTDSDRYEYIKNFFDEYDTTVQFCLSDFYYDVVDTLNRIMNRCEIPVRFKLLEHGKCGTSVQIIDQVCPYVKSIKYTNEFYDLITTILHDIDQEVSFVSMDLDRFVFFSK